MLKKILPVLLVALSLIASTPSWSATQHCDTEQSGGGHGTGHGGGHGGGHQGGC